MSERYSNLSPMPLSEQGELALKACLFFSPLTNEKFRKELNLPVGPSITPLSVDKFIEWLKKDHPEIERRAHIIKDLLRRLERAGIMVNAGSEPGFLLGLERCYYAVKESNSLEVQNALWLTEVLGLSFAAMYLTPSVVHLTSKTKEGDEHGATGIFLNNNTIVTCAHVISDMTLDSVVRIGNIPIGITKQLAHEDIDVGIVQLKQAVSHIPRGVGWGKGEILDEVVAMGYPPIPQTTATPLTVQRGEVTGYAQGTDRLEYMLFSSIARPGDSGGPLISRRGLVVGIVTRLLERQPEKADPMSFFPFSAAVPAHLVQKAVAELDPDLEFPWETYD
jgi:Trypsin-like peptidase domain